MQPAAHNPHSFLPSRRAAGSSHRSEAPFLQVRCSKAAAAEVGGPLMPRACPQGSGTAGTRHTHLVPGTRSHAWPAFQLTVGYPGVDVIHAGGLAQAVQAGSCVGRW